MELRLVRDIFSPTWTLGVLTVDGKSFGYVVEDCDRGSSPKIPGITCIPVGRYKVVKTWSPKYKRPMLLLENVPGFAGIRIHSGNDADDTEGCIIPGLLRDNGGNVSKSKLAVTWLEKEIAKVHATGKEVWITIERIPGAPVS